MTLLQISEDVLVSSIEAFQKMSLKLFFRLIIDLASIFILVRLVYFHIYKRRELFFTLFIFNLVIFFITFLLNKVDLSMGAAFGLFAVFSMLRYRTEDLSIKDMTYLFLVIAMGLMNAIAKIKGADDTYEYLFLGIINGFIIILTYALESQVLFKREEVQVITYDNLELIQPKNRPLLLEDLKIRTGLNVTKVSVVKMDLTKSSVQLKVYYLES